MAKTVRVGIIGAGYIADWHADALSACGHAQLSCVVDASQEKAKAFASARGITHFTSVAEMLSAGACDAAHILTPPDHHRSVAELCIAGGLHVLVEKPVVLSRDDAVNLVQAAQTSGVRLSAGHNFLGLPSYTKLKKAAQEGTLGRISAAEINWCFPLPSLRSGPYGTWLMRKTRNLLYELGPHLFAFANDLFGPVDILHVSTSNPISIPGGGTRPQGFRILARAGSVDVTFNISLVETLDDRSVTLRGSSQMARLDYARDTLVIVGTNTSDLVLNPFRDALAQSLGHLREGSANAVRQLVSLNQKSPYALSFRGMCDAVYKSLRNGDAPDPRFSAASVEAVTRSLDAAVALLPPESKSSKPKGKPRPSALVIGGTGFIGRALTRKLAEQGTDVRVLSRGASGPFDDISDKVELFEASLKDETALSSAMKGITHVYHLAKSDDKTWADALENDVGVTERIARAAMSCSVERLIYTGTIASYDMSDPSNLITEETGFAEDMEDRNIYARSKAECERRLLAMHHDYGLPVTIARPGIVLGKGGPLQHWGIGRWHGAGAVKTWGNGNHTLPFVLIDDVSDGLILMAQETTALGESFNLVGEPMLSALGYFDAIHEELGARIKVSTGSPLAFHGADALKFFLKHRILRRKGLSRPSYRDWKSRAHYSSFDNSKPKRMLGWMPESSRERFVKRAITEADLFGF